MVDAVVVDATVCTPRQRYLADAELPGPSPAGYALDVAKEVFSGARIALVGNSGQAPLREAGSRGVEVVTKALDEPPYWRDFLRELFPGAATAALLRPLRGVVSAGRARHVAQEFAACRPALALSAMRVEPNAHPSFNRCLPKGCAGKRLCTLHGEREDAPFDTGAHLDPALLEHFPEMSAIPGSQWVPELFQLDGAVAVGQVAAFANLDRPDAPGVALCAVEPEADLPVLGYRLPVFLFREDTVLEKPGGASK